MRTRVVVTSGVVGLVLAVMAWAPALAAGQETRRAAEQTIEEVKAAAREVALRSEAESAAIWAAELERRKAILAARVYDPGKPVLSDPPRTPWGDPDLRGYFVTATYSPQQRPPWRRQAAVHDG